MAGKPMQLGGKMFWFNVQTAKNGSQYLSITGDVKGSKEKLTMFPNQIPSFIHMIRESYGEILREMKIEPLEVVGEIEVEKPVVEPKLEKASRVKPKLDDLLKCCPKCGLSGTEELKPDVSMRNGSDLIAVQCIDGCGYKWPEGEDVHWGSMMEASKIWDQDWLIEVFKRWR